MLIIFCCIAIPLNAVDVLHATCHVIDTQIGLPENRVRSMVQLPDRRMLFVTESTICIYNGENVTQLKSPFSDALCMNGFCDQVMTRVDGKCWIRLANQLKILNISTEHFVANPQAFLSSQYGIREQIDNVFFDMSGGVYLTTIGNELYYLPAHHQTVRIKIPYGFQVVCAAQTKTSICLFSTDGRIYVTDRSTYKHFRIFSIPQLLGMKLRSYAYQTTCVSQLHSVIFSVRTSNGKSVLASLDITRGKLNFSKVIDDVIRTLCSMQHDKVLVTSAEKIYLFDRNCRLLSQTNKCLTDKGLENIFKPIVYADCDGGVWIAQNRKGIMYASLHTVRFQSLSGASLPQSIINNAEVISVVPHTNHQFIAAFKSGLWIYDLQRQQFSSISGKWGTTPLLSVTKSVNNRIWITALSGYTYVWEHKQAVPVLHHFVTAAGRQLTDIDAVYDFGTSGCYVVSRSSGLLIVLDKVKNGGVSIVCPIKNRKLLPMTKKVTNASKGLAGSILFTTDWGLFIYHPHTGKIDFPADVDSQARIVCGDLQFHDVTFDSRGWLWLAHLEGLTLYNRKYNQTTFYSKANGLPNNIIQSVIDCGENKMCVGTSEGIALIKIISTDDYHHPIVDIQPLGAESGLLEGEYSPHCAAKMADGTIVIGGVKGLSILPARELHKRILNIPPIYTALYVKGDLSEAGDGILDEAVSYTHRIDLPYDSRSFSFEFASPNYANNGITHYRYRLMQGTSDASWIYLPSRHAGYVSFQFLPSGHYRLEVQSSLLNSDWSPSNVMDIVVHSPWYWNFWSKSCYLLVICLVGYYEYTMRRQRSALEVALRLQDERNKYTSVEQNMPKQTFNPHDLNLPTVDEELMIRVMDKLESHISDEGYGVEQLSSDVGMARVTLYRKMKMITGQTPVTFIRTIRLKKATQYLQAGKNVNETAYLVGFSDVAYFRKCFKSMYGTLPKSFK
jgi:AraC-like DNA-binding protein